MKRTGEELGGYVVAGWLGSGGMGTVYDAVDGEGRHVALKLLHPHLGADPVARARLRREVETLQRVRHPGVARVLDSETDSDDAFVVTELIDGATLDTHVRERGPLPLPEVAELGRGLMAALLATHDAGVVHRDIKPANVMLTATGPVLIDFGISQVVDAERYTQIGLVTGTAGYLDPRVVAGEAPDRAADWWSWVGVLAFAATGRPPFGGGPPAAVLARASVGDADLTGLPAAVAQAFRAALRPSGSRLAPTDLLAVLEGDPSGAAALAALDPPKQPAPATRVLPSQMPPPPPPGEARPTVAPPPPVPMPVPTTPPPTRTAPPPSYPPAQQRATGHQRSTGHHAPSGYGVAPFPPPPQHEITPPSYDAARQSTPYRPPSTGDPYRPPYQGSHSPPPPYLAHSPPPPDWASGGEIGPGRSLPGQAEAPALLPPAPARPAVLLVLWVLLAALAAWWPGLVLVVVLVSMIVAGAVGSGVRTTRRRLWHGKGRNTGLVWLLTPWHLVRALLVLVPAVVVGGLAGAAVWWGAVLALTGDIAGTGALDATLLSAVTAGSVAAAVGVAWVTPPSLLPREGARQLLAVVLPGRAGTVVAVVVGLLLALVLGALAAAGATAPNWWPLPPPPL